MWQSKVYISRYKSKIADLMENKIAKIPNLAYARAESIGYDIFALECLDEVATTAKSRLEENIAEILLNNYKFDYIVNECAMQQSQPHNKALICALVFYNREYERRKVAESLRRYKVYSLDGIFDFAMEQLKFDWSELSMMSYELLSYNPKKNDIYQIVSYLGKGNKIRCRTALLRFCPAPVLIDGSSGFALDNVQLFDDPYDDVVATLIYNRVEQLAVERENSDRTLVEKLVNLVKIKFV
ncbi:MAG: hypothetical protein ACI4MI_05320 [Christensenellales bacterium]